MIERCHSRRNSPPQSPFRFARTRVARCRAFRARATVRGGFTLIEMLVALAITLIMMGAVVSLFGVVSESVSKSRSMIEISDRLRAAREIIQQDLQGATATLRPPLSPESDQGYFEIIEGPAQDFTALSLVDLTDPTVPTDALFGDIDDVLMFTVRSRSGPFLGKYTPPGGGSTRIIESPVAEVVYFLVQNGPLINVTTNPPTRLCTLYRRVLLVSPSTPSYVTPFNDFYERNDVSVHFSTTPPSNTLIPNTLGDLTKRENRFAHYGDLGSTNYGQFPFIVNTTMLPQLPFVVLPATPTRTLFTNTAFPTDRPDANAFLAPLSGTRLGEDVLLTNVIAFDVRVWDPQAPIGDNSGIAVAPGDPGWNTGLTQIATGAYVDLGYNSTVPSMLGRINPHQKVPTQFGTNTTNNRVWDTWSLHYENDGIDNDGDTFIDLGTNGLDDAPTNGLIDDPSEWDTQPPYTVPLRGIQITVRVYEPSSQQVREAVIVQNFSAK